MKRFIAGVVILAVVVFALLVSHARAEEDPDGIEAIMFSDDGSVNTEPFAIIHLHIDGRSCDRAEI